MSSLLPVVTAPVSSSTSATSSFPINEECTSITITSSGRLVIAGFTDGTIRLFDRTGTFGAASYLTSSSSSLTSLSSPSSSKSSSSSTDDEQEFDTAEEERQRILSEETTKIATAKKKSATFMEVNSSYHQRYGAVACQIVARGVHTALRLDCVVSEDDQYCFASVARGNMECVAIHIGPLEDTLAKHTDTPDTPDTAARTKNLLDYVHVYRHSDAKLRGLGACTRLGHPYQHHHGATNTSATTTNTAGQYLLLTGKSIKNIHIWSFQPPPSALSAVSPPSPCLSTHEPIWQCLYDCPTNGNTIQWLAFRRAAVEDTNTMLHHTETQQQQQQQQYKLQAISKSLHQKLRVWDISHEEQMELPLSSHQRPNRPPYKDIFNTECALGIAGNWIVCGGELFDNQISIVALENTLSHQPSSSSSSLSVYNHTELALPASTTTATPIASSHAATSAATSVATTNTDQRRQQRGDMKCVVSVSGIQNHVVLELSDGSVAEYRVTDDDEDPNSIANAGTSNRITMIQTIEKLPDNTCTRQLSVRRIVDSSSTNTNVVALVAAYQPVLGRGTIGIHSLIQGRKVAEPLSAERKVGSKPIEEHLTPIPINSKTKPTTLSSDAAVSSELRPTKINVVTTIKKPRQDSQSLDQTNVGLRIAGQSALVTTTKKKTKSIKKQKRSDDSSTDTTLYHRESGITIPKKQRIKATSTTSTSVNPSHGKPTEMDLSSFATPFPKNFIPNTSTDSQLASAKYDMNDNYLATIYENAPPNASSSKRFASTPLCSNRDSSADITVVTETKKFDSHDPQIPLQTKNPVAKVGDMSSLSCEPSPPIPRKRPAVTLLGKQERRSSMSTSKGGSAKSSTASVLSTKGGTSYETTTLQNITAAKNNIRPSSGDLSLISTKISSDAAVEGILVPKDDKNATPSTQEYPPSSSLPITNVRDRIIAICAEKLHELELFEGKVDVPLSATTLGRDTQPELNPYDKQYCSLMAHHYACHLKMRKRIIDATRATIYSIMDAPIVSSLDKAKGFLHSALISYQELSSDMVQLQRVEAHTVLAMQRQQSALRNRYTGNLNVSNSGSSIDEEEITFAFPELFQEIMSFLPVID